MKNKNHCEVRVKKLELVNVRRNENMSEINKYQEALDNIVIESCKHARAFDVGCKECKLKSHCNRDAKSWVLGLQELIDRTTAEKPKKE